MTSQSSKSLLSALLSACAVTLSATPALAQDTLFDEFGAVDGSTEYESPQDMAVELRFGPYVPNVDEEFQGRTPFADSFGNDTRWMIGFEVDWQLLRIPKFGSLGPGFSFGYTSLEGEGTLDSGDVAEQKTTLSILPMHVAAVVRVDTIARNTPVPLVPYGKVGLGYAMWWTNDGHSVERAAADGRRGEDTSYGLVWALGGMLLLDVFDRVAANDLDSTHGVNHSYVFLEWYNSDLDGFGSGKMQVGVNTWMAGIALEL